MQLDLDMMLPSCTAHRDDADVLYNQQGSSEQLAAWALFEATELGYKQCTTAYISRVVVAQEVEVSVAHADASTHDAHALHVVLACQLAMHTLCTLVQSQLACVQVHCKQEPHNHANIVAADPTALAATCAGVCDQHTVAQRVLTPPLPPHAAAGHQ